MPLVPLYAHVVCIVLCKKAENTHTREGGWGLYQAAAAVLLLTGAASGCLPALGLVPGGWMGGRVDYLQ